IGAESLPSSVRRRRGRLQEQQAFFRIGEVNARDPRSSHFGCKHLVGATLHDPFMILFRIQRARRQLETAAPLDSAVAGGAVASFGCEDSADIVGEIEGSRESGVMNLKLSLCAVALHGCDNRYLTVADGCKQARVFDLGYRGIGYVPLRTVGQVGLAAVFGLGEGSQLLARFRVVERARAGRDAYGYDAVVR